LTLFSSISVLKFLDPRIRRIGQGIILSSIDKLLEETISSNQTATLVVEDPEIKTALMSRLVEVFVTLTEVLYVDYDLQFSSSLQNLEEIEYDKKFGKNLQVLQPPDDALDFVSQIASKKMHVGGVLILDSLNSLQNVIAGNFSDGESKIANQRSALVITILQQLSRFYSKSLVIVNIAKARQRLGKDHSTFWEKSLVGGRMIKFKSDVILFAKEIQAINPEIEIRTERIGSDVHDKTEGETYLLSL
jgi:hypothetical protein